MTTGGASVSTYVIARLRALLDAKHVVVWYDTELTFTDLFERLRGELLAAGFAVVSAADSRLRARREADAAWQRLIEPGGAPGLLVYVPNRRGVDDVTRSVDPFEALARCGVAFGDNEGERLRALAEAAMPHRTVDIARLFASGGQSTLATLDALGAAGDARYHLLRQAFGADAPAEALARTLSRSDAEERLEGFPGAQTDLARLAETTLDLHPVPGESFTALRDRLAAWLLLGELANDLSAGLPPHLTGIPHAPAARSELVAEVLDRLRESDAGREALSEQARRIEGRWSLAPWLAEQPPGRHDTFPVQERVRLQAVVQGAIAGDLANARSLAAAGQGSLWQREATRSQIWAAVDRGLDLLGVASDLAESRLPTDARGLVNRYVAPDGLWRLDHAQRRAEQAAADCAHAEEVEPLVQAWRARYRAISGLGVAAFQAAVLRGEWPPEGVRRLTQTFDLHVASELSEGRRVALFLVDSLRYELGHDLAAAMDGLGTVSLEGVAAVLPTATPVGMAALLPGADGALSLIPHAGDLVPAIGETRLPGLTERRAVLSSRYGDRYLDRELADLLSISPKALKKQLERAELLVVRSLEIDDHGEGRNLYQARRAIGSVIGDLKTVAERLVDAGFETLVFAADHGHVLVPEIPAGDVLPQPPGEWLAKKRRSLLGHGRAAASGVRTVKAVDVGIISSVPSLELAIATGFRTFRDGEGYFHEGVSLQECIIPIIVVRASGVSTSVAGAGKLMLSYRSDRFTSGIVGLKAVWSTVLAEPLTVRIEAFNGSGRTATRVGEAGDCDVRDPISGEVTFPPSVDISIPLVIAPDFAGASIEIRATDPLTGVVHATLKLKNARLD